MDAPLSSVSSPPSAPYHPSLSPADRARLAKHPHCLDLPLSPEQLEFLHKEGYLVIKKMIPDSLCEKIVTESFIRTRDTMKVTRKDPGSWHGLPPHGILNIWHLPALYELRQHPLIYSLFAQLTKTHKLCVSLDRVSMKAPSKASDRSANDDLPLHTDVNYWFSDANRPTFQGGLCLEDCPAGGGGFFCLPEEHQPSRVDAYKAAVERGDLDCTIPGKATLFCPYANHKLAAQKKIHVRAPSWACRNSLTLSAGRTRTRRFCCVEQPPAARRRAQHSASVASAGLCAVPRPRGPRLQRGGCGVGRPVSDAVRAARHEDRRAAQVFCHWRQRSGQLSRRTIPHAARTLAARPQTLRPCGVGGLIAVLALAYSLTSPACCCISRNKFC